MLFREIIAVCSQIHTKHINTLCGQNVELLYVTLDLFTSTSTSHCHLRAGIKAELFVICSWLHRCVGVTSSVRRLCS